MSNKLITAVYKLPISNVYERAVLLVLANRYNDKSGLCYPSMKTVANEACCSERKAQNVIKKCLELGYIRVKKNAGPRGCNLYEFSLPEGSLDPPHAIRPRMPYAPAHYAPPYTVHPRTTEQSPPHATTLDPAQRADEPKENQKEPCQDIEKTVPQKSEGLNKVDSNYVKAIRNGEIWVVNHVKPQDVQRYIAGGHVTADQCRKAGFKL